MRKCLIMLIGLLAIGCGTAEKSKQYDIVVYGGTSAGVAAAIQGSRMNKSVLIIEPSQQLGGLTTGGLGATDIGNKQVIGGIAREFYQNIRKYYDSPENWKWQKREEYFKTGERRSREGEDAMWTFEPSAALAVYKEMMAGENIEVVYGERLNRETGVKMNGTTIAEIAMESGKVYEGKMFIDATYEGDLMAASGVSYTVGRESNDQYGETLNGVQANFTSLSLRGDTSRNSRYHNFIYGVDPYVKKGDKTSGLLPYISADGPGVDGTGDKGLQAYCFRMCLTDHPDNRIPFEKPADYDEMNYELLFRNYEASKGDIEKMYDYGDPLVPWINTPMPNRKTDTNNQKGFSTDFIGQNYDYPEASYEEREKIIEKHRSYQQGLMWTLAYHPRIPEKVRRKVSQWGLCKDEFQSGEGWQEQIYVREARRMVSDYVMTQHHCEALKEAEDAVGMAAYGMDSHQVKRYVGSHGFVQNEGNVEARVRQPYAISYRSIVPKKGECDNLIVPVCLSATHIAYGSIRMEPVFMVLGQSAATSAALSIEAGCSVQDLDYDALKKVLLQDRQILENPKIIPAKQM
jgi:hypothetical protein